MTPASKQDRENDTTHPNTSIICDSYKEYINGIFLSSKKFCHLVIRPIKILGKQPVGSKCYIS